EIHRNLRHVFSSWNEVSRGELNSPGENAYGSAACTHRLSSRRTSDYMDIRPDFLPQTSTDTRRRQVSYPYPTGRLQDRQVSGLSTLEASCRRKCRFADRQPRCSPHS